MRAGRGARVENESRRTQIASGGWSLESSGIVGPRWRSPPARRLRDACDTPASRASWSAARGPSADPARAADRRDRRTRRAARLPEPQHRPDQRARGDLERDLLRAVRRPRRVPAGRLPERDRADARTDGRARCRRASGRAPRGRPSPSCCGRADDPDAGRVMFVEALAGGPRLRAELGAVLDGDGAERGTAARRARRGRRHARHPRPGAASGRSATSSRATCARTARTGSPR